MIISSHKRTVRFIAVLAAFVALSIALPQLARMSESRNAKAIGKSANHSPQSEKVSKPSAPQGKEEAGDVTNEVGVLTLPDAQRPKAYVAAPRATASVTIQNEVEPNNTTATASPITGTGARITAPLFPNGDIDFYSFTATAGDRVYMATMTSFSAGSSTDSQLTLLASDGTTVIEFDDDNGSLAGLSSSIAGATIPTTGTYFIKVNDFTAGTTSERPYDLWFQLQSGTGSPTAEVESNDTPATANPLPASGWVSGTRNPAAATEQDWYSMTLSAGDTVFLSLDLDPERDGTTWNGRLGLALFGDAGNQILVVDDAGTGDVTPIPNRPSEAFFMTVKDAGTYFAFVDSASAATGGPTATYHLNVSVLPRTPVGVNCTTYTSTDVPKTIGPGTGLVSSTITVPGNPRIASIRVFLTLNHALMADIDAHLRTPAGNDIGLFTDIGAAATGGQTQMDIAFDDRAGIPPAFTVLKGLILKPELAYRLGWLTGEDAGGTWTLDLRDDTAGANGGTLTAWSIEICEQPPAPTCGAGFTSTTVFSTDFESGAAGFTHSGTADEWELGLPATAATTTTNPIAAFTTANSGVNAWKTDLDNTYNVSSSQDLLSPNINLAGLSGPITLSWAMKYQMESASFDHAFVEVREVGGANPVKVWEWLDATMTDAPGNPTTNIGASAGWGNYRADISSFAGKNIEVRFHLDSDTTINFGGLAIDDVSVTACQPCPAITCPANISVNTDSGVCSAVVNYTPPTSTGCTVTCNPAPGFSFLVGTTTVTCNNGGSSTCMFTVTVTDNSPPVLTCPANISTPATTGACSATVTFSSPTVVENCSLQPPGVTCSPASGSSFNVGTTTVTCSATDLSGNPGSCSFTVTVTDTQNPTLTCPANQTVNGTGPTVVNYTTPTANDNCPGATTSCSPASGSTFPLGTTTVTCTATDASMNTATCTFTVTVAPSCTGLTCPANITQSNDANQCGAVVTYSAPTAGSGCGTVTCSPASGSFFPKGTTTVTCSTSGGARPTTPLVGGSSCTFTVTVNDTQPPTITCPANAVSVATPSCPAPTSATFTYATPTAADNCPGVTVSCTPASGTTFPAGTTTVSCTATDASGNTATCSFTVKLFNVAIQDRSNASAVLAWNTTTGEYVFCCNGSTFTGVGKVATKGCTYTLDHIPSDRRVHGSVNMTNFTGDGYLQTPPGVSRCSISDNDVRNNTYTCLGGAPPPSVVSK